MRPDILTLVYVLFFFVACSNLQEEIIDIQDLRGKGISPGSDIANHKYKDVEIFRTDFLDESYAFGVYGMENDKLRFFMPFMQEIKGDYDKAAYHWDNDTTLLVRFYDTRSTKEANFRLTGDILQRTGNSRIETLDK